MEPGARAAPAPDHNDDVADYVQRQRGIVYILLNAARNLGRGPGRPLCSNLLLLFDARTGKVIKLDRKWNSEMSTYK